MLELNKRYHARVWITFAAYTISIKQSFLLVDLKWPDLCLWGITDVVVHGGTGFSVCEMCTPGNIEAVGFERAIYLFWLWFLSFISMKLCGYNGNVLTERNFRFI